MVFRQLFILGLFGMNLLSHLENHDSMFYVVTALMSASMLAIFISLTRFGRREKLF